MICSGENPFLAIYPPFCEIISGIFQGGHVKSRSLSYCTMRSKLSNKKVLLYTVIASAVNSEFPQPQLHFSYTNRYLYYTRVYIEK
jgi:hypothetical protein